MPLINGKSQKAFGVNVKRETDAGKPQSQALAIAYNVKREAMRKKKAKGGLIEDQNEKLHVADEDEDVPAELMKVEHLEASPDDDMDDEDSQMMSKGGLAKNIRDPSALAQAIVAKKKMIAEKAPKGMADGGMVNPNKPDANLKEMYDSDEDFLSDEHPEDLDALFAHDDFLSDEEDSDHMAEGGMVDDEADPKQKRKGILQKVMMRLHNEHSGK